VKALVIESTPEETKNISFTLQLRWPQCTVLSAVDGSKGIELIEAESPDFVILDVALSGMDGLGLVSKIRSFCDVPVIILTDNSNEMIRVSGLEMGADEYVTKPFNPIELLAKVVALLRRVRGAGFKADQEPLTFGALTLNFSTREVFIWNNRVKLTPIEYNLLTHLVRNEGKVLTHSALLEKVWGRDYADDSSFIKKYIYRLRSKLRDDASNPRILISERGVGYRFVRPS